MQEQEKNINVYPRYNPELKIAVRRFVEASHILTNPLYWILNSIEAIVMRSHKIGFGRETKQIFTIDFQHSPLISSSAKSQLKIEFRNTMVSIGD